MKRILILVVLVALAGIAGAVVRSSSSKDGTVAELRELVSHNADDAVRDEIRQSYELAPGARVEVAGINGAVKIETADTKTAEIYIERRKAEPSLMSKGIFMAAARESQTIAAASTA